MSTVYVLWHDDRMYDMGDSYIRGIYLAAELAEADVVTRTPSGAKSRAYGAHNNNCCSVQVHDLRTALTPDVDISDQLVGVMTAESSYR